MKWTIKSHKLVHFNPRHKHLRFCHPRGAEHSHKGDKENDFARYRRTVSHVLDSLETTLKNLPVGGSVSPYNGTKPSENNGVIKITNPPQGALWEAYLDYCIVIAKVEDVGNQVMDVLRQIKGSAQPEIPKKHALDILSVMPALPHWDVMGIFSQETNRVNTVLRDMLGCQEPVLMMKNSILFSQKGDDGNQTDSKKILGYPVLTRVAYADLASSQPCFQYTHEEDYYSYFHNPILHSSINSELAQYRAYGLLYDSIEDATVREDSNLLVDEDLGSVDLETFTLIYPIVTLLGRRNFWHIHLQPDDQADLEDLVEAWRFLHGKIDWPLLRAIVSSELEQVDWAYAQSVIAKEIGETISNNVDATQVPEVNNLVAKQAMMFFPMCSLSNATKKWSYKKYHGGKLDEIGHFVPNANTELNCGWKWEESLLSADIAKESTEAKNVIKVNDISIIPDESAWQGKIPHQLKIRYQHVIEQQLELARQLVGFKDAERRRIARQKEITLNEFLMHIAESELYDGALRIDSDWKQVPLTKHVAGISTLGRFASLLLTKEESALDDTDKQTVICFAAGGKHALVSKIIECHPVKGLSHTGPDNQLNGLKAALKTFKVSLDFYKGILTAESWQQLVGAINSVDENGLNKLGSSITVKEKQKLFKLKAEECENTLQKCFSIAHTANSCCYGEFPFSHDIRWNLGNDKLSEIFGKFEHTNGWHKFSYCLSSCLRTPWEPEFTLYCVLLAANSLDDAISKGGIEKHLVQVNSLASEGVRIWYLNKSELYSVNHTGVGKIAKPVWATHLKGEKILATYTGWYTPGGNEN